MRRKFEPGQAVRVEHSATIVEQVPGNEYWYVVRYMDGSEDTVCISRLSVLADRAKAAIDTDGSILVLTSRLSAMGALDLYQWLGTHIVDLEEATRPQEPEPLICDCCGKSVPWRDIPVGLPIAPAMFVCRECTGHEDESHSAGLQPSDPGA